MTSTTATWSASAKWRPFAGAACRRCCSSAPRYGRAIGRTDKQSNDSADGTELAGCILVDRSRPVVLLAGRSWQWPQTFRATGSAPAWVSDEVVHEMVIIGGLRSPIGASSCMGSDSVR